MHKRNVIRGVFTKLAALAKAPRRPAFACGDCEHWRRCGLPPSDRCVVARGARPVKRLALPCA